MFANTKMTTGHKYNQIGGFCPHCHTYEPIGDVKVSATINFRPDSSPEIIRFHHCSLMNMESVNFTPFIEIICPECGGRMIQIDDNMSDAICNFNNSGFFTKASCDGGDSYSQGYISFYDIDRLIELIDRTEMFTKKRFIYDDEPYLHFSYNEEGCHSLSSLIFDLSGKAIRPFTDDAMRSATGIYIKPEYECENHYMFIERIKDVSREIGKWFAKYASREHTDDMSLSQYIEYINR